MPVQQITVVPTKETASNGKSSTRSKDKTEGRKAPGRSGSRSSNISKASNSTAGPATASRTSITPSSQDICSSSQLTHVEEDVSESQKPEKPTHSSVMSVTNTTLGSAAPAQKKQVKRRHRRKKSGCPPDSVETNGKPEHSELSLSSDRSELGVKRERTAKTRKELPPRLRTAGGPPPDSTSEEEAGREDRSWSKEKARRVRRRSGSSRERDGANEGKEEEDKVMELQSVCSDEGKESLPLVEESAGLKKRSSSSRASVKRDEHASQREGSQREGSQRGGSQSREKEKSSKSDSSSLSADGEELITKRYQEKGAGGGDISVPTLQNHCAMNGSTQAQYSDDSDTEVCRICHCEGDDECALITPCRCTGSLSFVHQFCLNQWIRSSDTRCCELCKFDFVMEMTLKPLWMWERLNMSKAERRKIFFSVAFHLLAVTCMLLSVFVLVMRTSEEIKIGRNGVLEWPFWTKLIMVALGLTGGLIFMYIQCKVYLQLWRRLKAYNRIITVQNCPEKDVHHPPPRHSTLTNGRQGTVEVPISPEPSPAPEAQQSDSEMSVEDAVAPAQNPV
ncbi:hypothetical protein NQZ68_006056 [Dissostichus eleginoides]|uniref:E3 ubiquitin-protein ligase MARCH1 n=1 Tax=Dissostichus eleginoides TaxID=100907 RepID=A0AAD9BMR5_DISEL|nr:hypothetical protein NQZ68_006056 [Dissostichus eleginoides]KAK1886301.1 E3 ubiquitin-protein ligase MARCH1 [Dissostichus eleginoides]